MKLLFLNGHDELKENGMKYYKHILKNLERYINDIDVYEEGYYDDEDSANDLPPFSEYGLCLDYVEPGTFEDEHRGYWRYQLAYGGPTVEFRFYKTHTEFVYLDWYSGVGWDVSDDETVQWLENEFSDFTEVGYY